VERKDWLENWGKGNERSGNVLRRGKNVYIYILLQTINTISPESDGLLIFCRLLQTMPASRFWRA